MEREKLNIEPTQMQVVDRNKINYVPIEHIVMDSLYFDNIYQKMVFIQLKRFANWHTQEAYPSRALLSKLCCCGETKIKTTIKQLEEKKLIEVKERYEDGKQLSNLYIILEYPQEMYDKHYKNEGGHDTPPGGSYNAPGGVATRPRGGHDTPTKEIDFKEKKIKDKKIKNMLTRNDLINLCNSFYTTFSVGRWSKKQWTALIEKYVTETDWNEVAFPKAFIEGSIKGMARHFDYREGKILYPFDKDGIDYLDSEGKVPFYNWLEE